MNYAHFGFMDTLRDTLLSVSDHTMLERCGIVTSVQSFGSKRVICRDSPCVLHQNDLFQSFWRLAFSMVRSHATVLSRHTSGCPYVLAGILHPTKWHQSLDFLRRASEAYEAAKVSTVPEIVAMVKNCQLQGSVMRLAVLFGRAGDWRVITSQLRELCQGLFEGMGASKMAEDCIMKMRDHETRDAPSKSAARFRNWSVPVNSKLVEAYGRTEVVPTGNAQVPAEFSDNRLFEVTHTKSDAGDSVPLRGVLSRRVWPTFNSKTVQACWSELHLLMDLHRRGNWALAQRAWQIWLWPEGARSPALLLGGRGE